MEYRPLGTNGSLGHFFSLLLKELVSLERNNLLKWIDRRLGGLPSSRELIVLGTPGESQATKKVISNSVSPIKKLYECLRSV